MTGLVCSGVEVVAVMVGSGTGVEVAPVIEVAMVVVWGQHGCNSEGSLHLHKGRWRDVVTLVLQWFKIEGGKKQRKTHLSWWQGVPVTHVRMGAMGWLVCLQRVWWWG